MSFAGFTDGHQVARRLRQALSAEYLHFQASKRAGVELNQGVPVWAGRQTLSADGQPAEEACPYSAKARPAGWQLPPGIAVLWRRETDLHPDRASESVRCQRRSKSTSTGRSKNASLWPGLSCWFRQGEREGDFPPRPSRGTAGLSDYPGGALSGFWRWMLVCEICLCCA